MSTRHRVGETEQMAVDAILMAIQTIPSAAAAAAADGPSRGWWCLGEYEVIKFKHVARLARHGPAPTTVTGKRQARQKHLCSLLFPF